jgi:hypothetical protein
MRPSAMQRHDWLLLTAIVVALALMFFVSRHSRGARVQPGSPEYEAYIERYVVECLRKGWADDSTEGSSTTRSQAEREAACREYVLGVDRANPESRPRGQ